MFTLFKILLLEDTWVLLPTKWVTRNKRVKSFVKNQGNVQFLLKLLEN